MRRSASKLGAVIGTLFAVNLAAGCEGTGPVTPEPNVPAAAYNRAHPTYTFTSIDVPEATLTAAQGINAAGQVAGWYWTSDGRDHGFVLSKGEFTTIDYPDAYYTDVRGIGPNGELVGTFAGQEEPVEAYHGFVMSAAGGFTATHYAGHEYEILQRILPDGTILGCGHDENTTSTMVGIVMGAAGSSEIDAYASMHNGATPDLSRIVGLYTNTSAGRTEGYVIDDGEFAPLLVPGAIMTAAWDVNPRGDIVGIFRDLAGFHGFVWTEAGPTTLDFPGAAATRAFGVNERGDVVGTYVAGGATHGFLATRVR